MTDDLVRRLECYADLNDAVYHPWVYKEAADRIKKLEAALREIADGAVADNADDACHVLMKMARKTLEDIND